MPKPESCTGKVSATGKLSGVTSIVPGPPEGPRGSTGWGHPSRRAPWAEVGGEPPLVGWCAPLGPPLRLGLGTLGEGAPPLALGGKASPLAAAPPRRSHLLGLAPPLGDPIYRGGEGGQPHPCTWRLPSPLLHLSLPQTLGEALPGSLLHPPPRRRAAGSSSTSPSPLLDQEGGDVMLTIRMLNAEVPSVRR